MARQAKPLPATSFCEYADTKPRKTPIWFALAAPVDGLHELFGFLTTEANAIVAPIHPKAMPLILTTAAEVDMWLRADVAEALTLQRPLANGMLTIVAKGERESGGRGRLAAD